MCLHGASARASFCARVGDRDAMVFTGAAGCAGMTLPNPENVALAGAPNIAGSGEGAARQESAVVHVSVDTGGATQRHPIEQSCASKIARPVSVSSGTSFSVVMKNTSLPLSLASKNSDSVGDVPEEISPTQPPEAGLNVALAALQFSVPAGSNS
jgi:hypothetical protein